jgi:hypothetical protein
MPRLIYLAKANDKLVSHCKCKQALITFPPQMDCPWCGCGWLFTCIDCRKAFTFARGVELNESWEDIARRDLTNMWKRKPVAKDVRDWVGAMKELLADVEAGKDYVCLDGTIIPADAAGIEFEGWHSRHDLEYLPQVAALKKPSIVDKVLANPDYWRSNAVERED